MALLPHTFLRTVAVGTTAAASIAAIAAVAAVPAGAASAPDAYVRIEGARATLVGQTLVRTQSGDRVKSNPCSETSAAGALDDATHGKWSGSYSTKFGDYLVSSIDGETPTGNNFWTLFVNGRASSTGRVRDAAASWRPRPVVRLSGRRELQLHEQSARNTRIVKRAT